MSTENDGGDAEEFDLSDVPMDGEDDGGPDKDVDEEEDDDEEGEGKPAKAAAKKKDGAEGEREPLSPEEVTKRNDSLKIALANERRERRALERRLQALEEGREARGEGDRGRRREAEPEAEIDPDVDPIGALKQMRAKVAAYEELERQDQQTQAQAEAEERRFRQVEAQLAEHEADFRDDNPDYDDAAAFYAQSRARELLAYGIPKDRVPGMLRKEFNELAATAMKARKNPAGVVYGLSKERGFGKTPAAKDGKAGDAAKDGKGKIGDLIRGAKATNPTAGASRGAAELDAATVARINIHDPKGGEAFDKAFERLEKQMKAAERGR
jgi:hypothetical protein